MRHLPSLWPVVFLDLPSPIHCRVEPFERSPLASAADVEIASVDRRFIDEVLEGPRELGVETESVIGEVRWFLVLGSTMGRLERDAVILCHIPEHIAPDSAVVGPPEEALGDGGEVVVVDVVDKHAGMTVQVWFQVDESLDPAARGADRLPSDGIERLKNAAS